MGIMDKRGALYTLTRGDRVSWSCGPRSVWGTVTGVDHIEWIDGVNGPVFGGITITLRVPHSPTWDKWGWPAEEALTVKKTFRFSSDVAYAYAPPVPDAPRPIALHLACGHVARITSGESTGSLLADDATCPECDTPQWVTATRD
jgi:hypothetical protein